MLGKSSFRKRSATVGLLVFGVLMGAAWAQTETVLYNFCARNNCADGDEPFSALVFDRQGDLYGTTFSGGANASSCNDLGCGVVFKLTPKSKETVLHSFCAKNNCEDGSNPARGVIFDQEANLYGTTYYGGAYGGGVVFRLTPNGKETVLHNFCGQTDCADGRTPADLVFDRQGNLYGTTFWGGANFSSCNDLGCGVVFKLTPKGKETVLYNFCSKGSGYNCPDGALPNGVILDQKGNLYGTTTLGGTNSSGVCDYVPAGCGVVFKLTPKGKETVLYNFCAQGGDKCTDGADPEAGLTFDQQGNLYGTTSTGGAYDRGVVFKLTPEGKETVLYNFCAQGGIYKCTDGAVPNGVIYDQERNLYGMTAEGGAYALYAGIAFRLTPEGEETILHSFCEQYACTDGAEPLAGLVFDQKGNLYGTTSTGGAYYNWQGYSGGVVFKLTP